jgi:transposase
MMGQKTFSREFKRDSAALVLDQNYSHKEACEAVGVGISAMRRWVHQLQAERQGHTPETGKALTDEQLEIQQLNRKIKRLELEKEILKKATALLMSDTLNVTR